MAEILLDIAALRAKTWLSPPPPVVRLLQSHWLNDGGGSFRLWEENTTTPDDGGIYVRDDDDNLWRRQHEPGAIEAVWFGARFNGLANDQPALQTAIHYMLGWQITSGATQSVSFSAVIGHFYPVDTTSGSITATLPSSGLYDGCRIGFYDVSGNWHVNSFTINPNGQPLMGVVANITSISRWQSLTYEWDAATGWKRAWNGGTLILPNGRARLNSALGVSQVPRASIHDTCTLNIKGQGRGATHLVFTHAGPCFDVYNADGWGAYFFWQDFSIIGIGAADQIGIRQDGGAWFSMARVDFWLMDRALDMTDVLSCSFMNCLTRANQRPSRFRFSDVSRPNSIDFQNHNFGTTQEGALEIEQGSCIRIHGQLEGNGRLAGESWSASEFAMKFTNCGVEGAIGVVIDTLYCEGNIGNADIVFVQSQFACRHVIRSSSFVRYQATTYTTNNIFASHTGGDMEISIHDNSFRKLGAYVEDAARRYWSIPSTVGLDDRGNTFGATVAIPDDAAGVRHAPTLQNSWVPFNASTRDPGALMREGRLVNITGVFRSGTTTPGDIILTLSGRFAPAAPFEVTVPCYDGADWNQHAILLVDSSGVRVASVPNNNAISVSLAYQAAA